MITKLLASQIPTFWEVIKFVVVKVDKVKEENQQRYLNELLHALLNEKAQCFVRLDRGRNIIALYITRIRVDNITSEKYLFIQNVYSFKAAIDKIWIQDADLLKEFAKKEECSYLSFRSNNKRIWEIGKMVSFREKYRVFDFQLKE